MEEHCPNCREPYLGEVNRCWKCGAPVVRATAGGVAGLSSNMPQTGPGRAPPDFRSAGLSPGQSAPASGLPAGAETASGDNGPILAQIVDPAPAVRQPLPGPAAIRPSIPRPAAEPLSQLLSPICAALALVSSLGSVVYSVYSPLALIPAGLAIVLGACGVYSRLRGAALLGILLASLAIGICMFQIAAEYYQVRKGVSPFAPNAPVEPGGRL